MPPLSDELFGPGGSNQKPSLGRDLSVDNSDRVNNHSEFFNNIKEALNNPGSNQ